MEADHEAQWAMGAKTVSGGSPNPPPLGASATCDVASEVVVEGACKRHQNFRHEGVDLREAWGRAHCAHEECQC